jgi:hypothetical protein
VMQTFLPSLAAKPIETSLVSDGFRKSSTHPARC